MFADLELVDKAWMQIASPKRQNENPLKKKNKVAPLTLSKILPINQVYQTTL